MTRTKRPDLPSQTVRGRLANPVEIATPPGIEREETPKTIAVHSGGIFAAWSRMATLHSPEDGRFINCWPKGALDGDSPALPFTPVLSASGVVAADPEARRLVWLHPGNLSERTSIAIKEIDCPELEKDGRRLLFLSGAPDEQVCMILSGSDETGERRICLALYESGRTTYTDWCFDGIPHALIHIPGGFLTVIDEKIHWLPEDGAEHSTVETPGPSDRLWPSPDGRYIIVTGDGAPRFGLLEASTVPGSPPALIYQGMHFTRSEEHGEGWLFWDVQAPNINDPSPLVEPAVAWDGEAGFAVLGDRSGVAALIYPSEPRAIKLMVPPDKPFLPLATKPPDTVFFSDRTIAGSYVLDWNFREESAEMSEAPEKAQPIRGTEESEKAGGSEAETAYRDKQPPPSWLLPAVIGAVLLAAILGWLLIRN